MSNPAPAACVLESLQCLQTYHFLLAEFEIVSNLSCIFVIVSKITSRELQREWLANVGKQQISLMTVSARYGRLQTQ